MPTTGDIRDAPYHPFRRSQLPCPDAYNLEVTRALPQPITSPGPATRCNSLLLFQRQVCGTVASVDLQATRLRFESNPELLTSLVNSFTRTRRKRKFFLPVPAPFERIVHHDGNSIELRIPSKLPSPCADAAGGQRPCRWIDSSHRTGDIATETLQMFVVPLPAARGRC